jgi:hypothetical protein
MSLPMVLIVGVRQRGEPDRRARRARDDAGDYRQHGVHAVIVYLSGNVMFADLSGHPARTRGGRPAILCGAIIGAGLAFLWFNAPPAAVFMGDTGSLALGGALGDDRRHRAA